MPDRVPLIRVTAMPADTNPYGGVFGGWLMGQMGLACGSFASRHSGGKAVVVAADRSDLHRRDGGRRRAQRLCRAEAAGADLDDPRGRAIARERDGDQEFEVATGEFTFVALDENDKPREIAAKEESNG